MTTRQVHGLCPPEYYTKAADLMEQILGTDIDIFAFSDDPDWAHDGLRIEYRAYLITDDDGLHDYDDLRLRSTCRRRIVANSTSSYRNAWLNPMPAQRVIAACRWFHDPSVVDRELIPESQGWV